MTTKLTKAFAEFVGERGFEIANEGEIRQQPKEDYKLARQIFRNKRTLLPFLTKLASALTVVIASATYMLAGVTKYTNQISTYENAAASGQMSESDKLAAIHELLGGVSHSQSVGLLLVMTVLPYALMVLSYELYLRRYKLDEAEYDRICDELNARRESKSV